MESADNKILRKFKRGGGHSGKRLFLSEKEREREWGGLALFFLLSIGLLTVAVEWHGWMDGRSYVRHKSVCPSVPQDDRVVLWA